MKQFFTNTWTGLKTGTRRTWSYARTHKILSVIVLLIVVGGGYWGYTAMAAGTAGTEYVLSTVTQAPLSVTVIGSGQVSAQDTLNLTPQASGQITYIGVTPGEIVKAGTLVASLDMTTAAQAVTSARQNLESAHISYQQTVDSQNSSNTNDQTSLASAEATAISALSTNYNNLPGIMTGYDAIIHGFSTVPNYTAQSNLDAYENFMNTTQSHTYHDQVQQDDVAAVAAYTKVQQEYAAADPRTLSDAQIEQLNTDTVAADKTIATALKDTLTYYNYINDQVISAKLVTPTQLSSQISTLVSDQNTVLSDGTAVTNAQTSLINAQQSLTNDSQSLANSDVPLTLQSAQLNVAKAQESLDEALSNEADYEVRAPFDGEIATVPVNKFDQAGSGTTVATLITTEDFADLSLNETDAAKVKVGQPVSVTFDAISGFTMPGTVATIDPVGTVSQGVVTYDVKISFSQQDTRIKPGMTAEATITTASEASAIQVPSAAVKTTGNFSYVQVATLTNASSTLAKAGVGASTTSATGARRTRTASSTSAYGGFGGGSASSTSGYAGYAGRVGSTTGTTSSSTANRFGGTSGTTSMLARSLTVPASDVTLKTVPVTVGISNDTMTEITSGLTPGEYVVTATQSAKTTTKSAAASATSLLGGSTAGRTGAGGGFTGGGGAYTGARTTGATGGAAAR